MLETPCTKEHGAYLYLTSCICNTCRGHVSSQLPMKVAEPSFAQTTEEAQAEARMGSMGG